jgi:hypothetical protein
VSGVLQGGEGFVIAAYAVTVAVLGAYGASIALRYRAEKRRAAREGSQEEGR